MTRTQEGQQALPFHLSSLFFTFSPVNNPAPLPTLTSTIISLYFYGTPQDCHQDGNYGLRDLFQYQNYLESSNNSLHWTLCPPSCLVLAGAIQNYATCIVNDMNIYEYVTHELSQIDK